MVEQLIGPDIGGHPVWNLRTKTPQDEATTVPWHQGTVNENNNKGPRTLQRFSQRFSKKNRCENRCPYIKLLKNSLQL